jgi:multicomponent Na+:H+ antiporter subunit D
LNPMLTIIALIVSVMTLASFTKVFQSAFTGPALPEYQHVREVPLSMKVGMGILATATVLISLFPSQIVNGIVYPATDALLNQAGYVNSIMGGG